MRGIDREGEIQRPARIGALAETARARLRRLGYTNVELLHGDGTRGWPDHAPYDAIAVAAGGPKVPPSLLEQLALGGRLVMPIGSDETTQILVRITRKSATTFSVELTVNSVTRTFDVTIAA